MAGAAIAGGVADAHTLESARVIGRDGLALDRHGNLWVTECDGGAGCAPGQLVADALAQRDLAGDLSHASVVAPLQRTVAVGIALLAGFHIGAQHVAEFDGVHAVVVALVDDVGDGSDVVVAAVGAQRPGRLVLEALHVRALIRAFCDLDFLLAGHRTGVAGGLCDEDVLAHVLAGDLLGVVRAKGRYLRVVGGQRTDALGDVH